MGKHVEVLVFKMKIFSSMQLVHLLAEAVQFLQGEAQRSHSEDVEFKK
jgi:hypothetical protein